ncbi:hydroxysqualene dehydroxylase HpnE [Silvibacterium sp.]|uniref:hydroxysqualene dehydroxylase HpnE n=1 Tax=Silvibacterium sp. TaxID=1964179 RepID=UPI0039E570AD
MPPPARQAVIVVGGGVAGIAAGCALADHGYRVQLLERQSYLGGRACSYEHPGTGEVIDNCQHVLLGCCTNLIDLYRRLGLEDEISWFRALTLLEPGGRRSILEPSSMPAPLHFSASLLKASCFSTSDKITIAAGIRAFLFHKPDGEEESLAQWLEHHQQTEAAIRRFWHPLLVNALNEEPEHIPLKHAVKLFREAFLLSAEGGSMGIPRLPLSELHGRAQQYIEARGGKVHLRTNVACFERIGEQWRARTEDGQAFHSDNVILAVPVDALDELMSGLPRSDASRQLTLGLGSFSHAPIVSVHLWFDREVTDLTHAALLDSPLHWLFHKSKLQPGHANGGRSYIELVVTSSKSMAEMQRSEIIDLAMEELARFLPEVAEAVLVKATVIKEMHATCNLPPPLDTLRPGPESPWKSIYLAGDWTATGWPSSMESGVRSGYIAAEALAHTNQDETKFLVPDLQPTGWMKFFT